MRAERRIAIFLPSLRGGGAQRVGVQIANGMYERGLPVDLLLAEDGGAYRDEVLDGVRVISFGRARTLSALWPLVLYLRSNKPTTLLSGQPHGTVVAYLATLISGWGGRFIARETNSNIDAMGRNVSFIDRIVRFLVNLVYSKAAMVISPSHGVAEELSGQVVVIPNPLDTTAILRAASASPPVSKVSTNRFVLGVGRLSIQKRFDDLIRAFANLKQRHELSLVILGDGPERDNLARLAEQLGLSDRLIMPGFDPNPYRYMARCAVFVLSSGWEGLPNALLQAMACGAPVVATDCPHGPREILQDGRFGELVPVGDVEALSAAIARELEKGRRAYPPEALAPYETNRIIDAYASVLLGNG